MEELIELRLERGMHMGPLRCCHVNIEYGDVDFSGILGIIQHENKIKYDILQGRGFYAEPFFWAHYMQLGIDIKPENPHIMPIVVLKCEDEIVRIPVDSICNNPIEIKFNGKIMLEVSRARHKSTSGRLHVKPEKVIAGSRNNFIVEYTAGTNGIACNGGIRVLTPYSCWSPPSLEKYMINVISDNKIKLDSRLSYYSHAAGWMYEVKIVDGILNKGDKIQIRYDTKDGKGIEVQPFIEDYVYFRCLEDINGNGDYQPVDFEKHGSTSVIAGDAKRMRIGIQQVQKPGKYIPVRIRILDTCMNPVDWTGKVVLTLKSSEGVTLNTWDASVFTGFASLNIGHIDNEGYYILCGSACGIENENIVLKISSTDKGIFYGEIHDHTEISDGLFTRENALNYGHDVAFLDFCALSDHDWEFIEHPRNISRSDLSDLAGLIDRYYVENEYVTLLGYEWMGKEGHINAYFSHTNEKDLHPGHISILKNHPQYEVATEFIKSYENRDDVVLIPHTSHGFDFNYVDSEIETVVEIYSQWGCSEEKSTSGKKPGVRPALDQGFKFGFIGGADAHHGMPGQTGPISKYNILCHREGLAAVMSERLNRKDIFSNLKSRNCYATTGERVLLEFEVNDVRMGQVVENTYGSKLRVKLNIGATKFIKNIDIIGVNGKVVYNEAYTGTCSSVCELIKSINTDIIRENIDNNGQKIEYYYARVTLVNGDIAWSSPVYVSE